MAKVVTGQLEEITVEEPLAAEVEVSEDALEPDTVPTDQPLIEVVEYETPQEFLEYARMAISRIPQFSRVNMLSLERAISYLGQLASEIIKVCGSDLEGTLSLQDLAELETLYRTVDSQIDQLSDIKDSLTKKKKRKRRRSDNDFLKYIAADTKNLRGVDIGTVAKHFKLTSDEEEDLKSIEESDQLEKIATTTTYTYVPNSFISCIARDIINSKVSSGHNLEESYKKVCEHFQLDEREKYELLHTLYDLGQPIHRPMLFEFGPANYLA